MSAAPAHAVSPSGGADPRDVANAHRPFQTGRVTLWLITVLIAANFAWIVANNENFGWPVVAQYFFDPTVMQGLSVSLGLTVVAMLIGVVLGLLLAVARMSHDVLASSLSGLFVWFFRGTPLLVQLIFWYNLSTLFPEISIAIPFGPTLVSWETNSVITPMTAAIVGLALNEAAYMAEIIRGGLLSVDRGQAETAEAFGMTKARALWRIIIPQAMRSIVPPTGNQLISMIKATSLVSVIAMADLLYSVQSIYNRTFEIVPMLMVAVIWYLLITSVLNIGQGYIERYYGRGDRRTATAQAPAVQPEPTP
ncbi:MULTISPECIES: amino acid ABC transporter permease [Agrobacterium]|uniref:Glutamate/aspartate import permease protein GltK n=1 Tax=Agrobacterium rosae TaxID=1972867 RepID=A0A1R3TNE1_9HYPH|nr:MULTISPECIES: amino acid ABC transporter permease [Agrobacterium]MDX8302535.1 amino acid ABC transporter permease [Agrobacterium rosae]POO55788.1 amino acid ABC transporter permease [Agrobacterium rosae]SCX12087.1 Inner membrane amino-acid ABC transporter permease protein YecS [Agrobacterium rosae]SCX19814.1 Inner membrane amino-acid ABC transporter permease protein YecS [Agrobacterium sp. DSM 25558]